LPQPKKKKLEGGEENEKDWGRIQREDILPTRREYLSKERASLMKCRNKETENKTQKSKELSPRNKKQQFLRVRVFRGKKEGKGRRGSYFVKREKGRKKKRVG